MSKNDSHPRLLLKVSYLFYRLGLSHTDIATRLGLSRFQVARLLRMALDAGYVRVTILEPERWHADLERDLEARFGLTAAIVVDNDNLDDDEMKRRVADAAGRYLVETLDDGDVLGVSLGSTIQDLVNQLPHHIDKRVEVVQLIGGSSGEQPDVSPSILTAQLAQRFRTRPFLLHAPAVVGDGQLRRSLLSDSTVQATYARYQALTVAVLGIGALTHGTMSRLLYGGVIDATLLHTLLDRGAVGDILAYVYRLDGSLVASSLDDRMVAIPLPDLLHVRRRVGIVAGPAKVPAVLGALRGGFITVLVTDSSTAQAIKDSDVTQDEAAPRADGDPVERGADERLLVGRKENK